MRCGMTRDWLLAASSLVGLFPLDECSRGDDLSEYGGKVDTATGAFEGRGPNDWLYAVLQFGDEATGARLSNSGVLDTKYSLTIAAFVYPEDDMGVVNVVAFGSDAAGVTLSLVNGRVKFRVARRDGVSAPPEVVLADDPLPLEEWSHVVAVYNYATGTADVYVNGNATATLDVGPRLIRTGGRVLVGGAMMRLACLQLYNRALNASEVAPTMNCPVRKSQRSKVT